MNVRALSLLGAALVLAVSAATLRPTPARASACAGKKVTVPGVGGLGSTEYCKPSCQGLECNCRPAVCPDATSTSDD